MDTFLRSRRKAPQRRSMDSCWAEAELDKEWADLLKLAASTWKSDAAVLRLKLPSGAWGVARQGLGAPDLDALEGLEARLDAPWLLLPDLLRENDWSDEAALRAQGWRFMAALGIPGEGQDLQGSLWLFGREARSRDPKAEEALALLRDQAAHLHRLKRQIHGRAQDEDMHRTILQALTVGVVFVDREARILACNPTAERILGWSENQLAGKASVDERLMAIREDGSVFPEEAHPSIRTLKTGRPVEGVVQGLQRPDGSRTWISINAQPMRHPWEDKPHGVVVSFSDITRLKEVEERLRLQATRDALTGLHNRRHFLEALSAALKTAKRHRDPLSLCVCDLDHFKRVNDTYGHTTGDRAIQQLARLLQEEVRGDEDLPARLGGDEFVVLFPRSTAEEAALCLERVRARLAGEPLRTDAGAPVALSGSFGVAELGSRSMSEQELFEAADQALYKAKESGRNRIVVG